MPASSHAPPDSIIAYAERECRVKGTSYATLAAKVWGASYTQSPAFIAYQNWRNELSRIALQRPGHLSDWFVRESPIASPSPAQCHRAQL